MDTDIQVQAQSSKQPLLRVSVLGLAWLAGFCSRLFAVIRFESIIHEFDPWYVFIFMSSQFFLTFVYLKVQLPSDALYG